MPNVFTRQFVEHLHLRMYDDMWEWAGTQRQVDTNIGVPFPHIGVVPRELVNYARYGLDHRTYEPVEFAVRLHHRLVDSSVSQWQRARDSKLDGRDPRRQD